MPKQREIKRIDLPFQPSAALVGSSAAAGSGIFPTDPTITDYTNAQHTHQNAAGGGKLDHGLALLGLSDDDHIQYALLAGRATGQHLNGGTAASENLFLSSTASSTKGKLFIGSSAYDEANNRLGIGTSAPLTALHVGATLDALATAGVALNVQNSGVTALAVRNALADSEGFLMCDSTNVLAGAATNHDFVLRANNIDQLTVGRTGAITAHTGNINLTVGDLNFNSTVAPGIRWDLGGGESAAIRKNGSLVTVRVPTAGFSFQNNAGTAQRILIDDSGNLFVKTGYFLMGDQPTALFNGWGATANVASIKSSTLSVLELGGTRASGSSSVGAISFQNLNPGTSDDRVAQINALRGTTDDSADINFVTWNAGTAVVTATIKQDGKIGIGTAAPQTQLQIGAGTDAPVTPANTLGMIQGTADTYFAVRRQGAAEARIRATSAAGSIGTANNFPFILRTNDADRLTIDTSGRVGIGTTSPQAPLQVEGATETIRVVGTGGAGAANVGYISFHDGTGRRGYVGDASGANQDIYLQSDGGALRLRANALDGIYIESGQVGINNNAPGAALDVAGSAIIGAGTAGVSVTINGAAATSRDVIFRSAGVNRWVFRCDGVAETGSNAGSNFTLNNRADDGTSLSTPFYITRSSGFVGLGTSSPGYRLDVNGGGRFASTVYAAGDDGAGLASAIGLTNASNAAANSTGAGSVKMKGATNRDSVGFIKLWLGTTAIWVPYWTTITG